MSEILKIKNLYKGFGRKKVLEDFSLSLEEGKVYGLLGKNGEGKTTLIRMIMGIIPADSAQIFYKDKKLKFSDAAYKKEIGYIPEDPFYFGWMTVHDLLDLNSSFYPTWNFEKANEYLKEFALDKKARIRNLSRGMKLKLGLAVALASEPELLILDDPTSGIDVPTRHDFLKDIIKELCGKGTTVLFSTHLVHELERIVEHLCILHGGRLVLDEEYQVIRDSVRRIRLTFGDSIPEKFGIEGILSEKREGKSAELVVYPWNFEAERKLNALMPAHRQIEPLSLEEVFISFVC
jgi:ABC-2 type transport system ATP-binding protein